MLKYYLCQEQGGVILKIIGIDVGGTFTDFIIYETELKEINISKIPTSSTDPCLSIIEGIKSSVGDLKGIGDIRHGTTIGVNAVIERKGSSTALITTKGFRDILEIGRQKRPELYNLRTIKKDPLIPRNLRLVVEERIRADGEIITRLDDSEIERAAEKLKKKDIKSIAVLFLHSYIDNIHEHRVAKVLKKEIPHAFLSLSSEVLPEFREYERLSTTVLNAYLGPILTSYLKKLYRELVKIKVDAPLFISQSDGGIISARSAINLPVRTLYSGPGAGIVGAAYFYGKKNKYFVSLDMGGTSTDITLIKDSKPVTTTNKEINGYPYRFPSIDILTVGAGGGSIAGIDEGGFLQVGPASAGAEPGPVCYGKGGKKPTITDANLVLGTLGEGTILGGKIKVNTSKAAAAIKKYISEPLNISLDRGALSILKLAISNIADAVRKVSILRGIHPEDLKLITYGGAGPMHAAYLAKELGIKEVIIPNNPGVFSALGLLCSDLTMDFVKTVRGMDVKKILAAIKKLKNKGYKWLKKEGAPYRKRKLEWSVDIRYNGQNYEINIPMADPYLEIKDNYKKLIKKFHESHFRIYGHKQEGKNIEIVNLRLRCKGLISIKPIRTFGVVKAGSEKLLKEERTVKFLRFKKLVKTPVFNKAIMPLKTKIKGPAILEEIDSTIVIPPDDSAFLDQKGDLTIYINKK